jgi:hypothetical protein
MEDGSAGAQGRYIQAIQTCERRKHHEVTDISSESREAAAHSTGKPLPAASLVKPARQLQSSSEDLQERITLRAYELYAQRGWRDGFALEDWLDAEREILGLHLI